MSEEDKLQKLAQEIKEEWHSPRWEYIKRTYKPENIAILRSSISTEYPANIMAKKLWNYLTELSNNKKFSVTYGVLDTVQASNLAKYLKTIYISGWQCSATASITNDPGPDFADYPYNTVPNKVDQIFKALLFKDRQQNEEFSKLTEQMRQQTQYCDYLVPIIADADTGHGGTTACMKLVKLFIEAGAAGIHLEDQRQGTKKCGHMGGKVLVSTREYVNRLVAARLQADIMNTELLIIARTDALSARFIDSNIDPIDQPYIIGVVDRDNTSKLLTFPEAGLEAIKKKFIGFQRNQISDEWLRRCYDMSLEEAQQLAMKLGFQFYFDWDACRTTEGFYLVKGCIDFCVARCREYGKYSDMFWMETPTPNLKDAAEFATKIKQIYPSKFLAYNLSPSFNWDAFNLTDQQISEFSVKLGQYGYCWQFITLAGFHMNALISEMLAKDFSERHMIAYVQTIQRQEKIEKVDQLKHQHWSGAELMDAQIKLVNREASSLSTSSESTENQFKIMNLAKPKL